MLEKLKLFKSLNNMEKVFTIKELMPEFIHAQEKARSSMETLDRFLTERGLYNEGTTNGLHSEAIPFNTLGDPHKIPAQTPILPPPPITSPGVLHSLNNHHSSSQDSQHQREREALLTGQDIHVLPRNKNGEDEG